MAVRRWSTWIMELFAFWLAVSTWVYHFKGIAGWSNVVIGALAMAAGVLDRETTARTWRLVADWARAVFGAWFVVSAFVLSGRGTGLAEASNIVLGALILIGGVLLGSALPEPSGASARAGSTA